VFDLQIPSGGHLQPTHSLHKQKKGLPVLHNRCSVDTKKSLTDLNWAQKAKNKPPHDRNNYIPKYHSRIEKEKGSRWAYKVLPSFLGGIEASLYTASYALCRSKSVIPLATASAMRESA
jgi:hypothetical protein